MAEGKEEGGEESDTEEGCACDWSLVTRPQATSSSQKRRPWQEETKQPKMGCCSSSLPPKVEPVMPTMKKPKFNSQAFRPQFPTSSSKMQAMGIGSMMFVPTNMSVDECEDWGLYAAKTVDVAAEMAKRNLKFCPMCLAGFGKLVSMTKHKAWTLLLEKYRSIRTTASPQSVAVQVCSMYQETIYKVQRAAGRAVPPWEPDCFLTHVVEHAIDPVMKKAVRIQECEAKISILLRAATRVDANGDIRVDYRAEANLLEWHKQLARWMAWSAKNAPDTAPGFL